MGKVSWDTFKGMALRPDAHNLPSNYATLARNTQLIRGVLEPFKTPTNVRTSAAGVQSIYRYDTDRWIGWTAAVDVQRSVVAGDTAKTIIWTGDGVPKHTNNTKLALADHSCVVNPTNIFRLGVPAPENPPAVTLSGERPEEVTDVRTYVYAWMHGGTIGGMSAPLSVAVGVGQAAKINLMWMTPPPDYGGVFVKPTEFKKAVFLYDQETGQYALVAKLHYSVSEYTDGPRIKHRKRYKATAFRSDLINAPPSPMEQFHNDCSGTFGWTAGAGWTHDTAGGNTEYDHAAGDAGTLTFTYDAWQATDYVLTLTTANATNGSFSVSFDGTVLATGLTENSVHVLKFTSPTTGFHDINIEADSLYDGAVLDLMAVTAKVDDDTTIEAVSTDEGAPNSRSYVYCWIYQTAAGWYRTDASSPATVTGVLQSDTVTITGMAATPPSALPAGAKSIRKAIFRKDSRVDGYRLVKKINRSQTQATDNITKPTDKLKRKLASYPIGTAGSAVAPVATITTSAESGDINQSTRFYIYTYVTAWGEEGPPSLPSEKIAALPWSIISVSTDTTAPSGYDNIVAKRIYRVDQSGNWRLLTNEIATNAEGLDVVQDLPIGTATWDDDTDEDLAGEVLITEEFHTPPDDLEGLVAVPGSFLAGYVGNQLCASEPKYPYAWPIKYRKTTDYPIMGLGVTSAGVVVTTQGTPYFAEGNDPASWNLRRIDILLPCVSKRSVVDMGEYVIYASPEGLVSVAGAQAKLITDTVMTPAQFQAYQPESFIAVRYQQKYLAFFDTGITQAALLFDPADLSLVEIDIHAAGAQWDLGTDTLYVQIGDAICQWDNGVPMTMTWTGPRALLDAPTNPAIARIDADAYPVTLQLYADGNLVHSRAVADRRGFRLPDGYVAFAFQPTLSGQTKVNRLAIASSSRGLAG